MEQKSDEGTGATEQTVPIAATSVTAAATTKTSAPPPTRTARTRRWLTWGGCVLVVLALTAFGFWEFSPWERLSGPHGTPPTPLQGVPAHGAKRYEFAMDPVLVAGALIERHDGGVRAVNLRTGKTWWGISRPGRAKVDAVGRVDDRYAAIVWSDRRLTVVDVPTGHRTHVDLPDRSYANVRDYEAGFDLDTGDKKVTGLANGSGHSLVAVVQWRGVDAYDASSGRRLWTRKAPGKCGYRLAGSGGRDTGGFLSLDVDCPRFTPPQGDPVELNYAYSTLLGADTGRPLPGFTHFSDGSLVPVGTDRLLQAHYTKYLRYRVINSRTGREVWSLDDKAWMGDGFVGAVAGGDGLVVAENGKGRVTAFRAADGKQLWQRTLPASHGWADVRSPAVVAGQVRVVEFSPRPLQVITFTSTGAIAGREELPMFASGGYPWIVGGDYGTLLIQNTNMREEKEPGAYVYLSATH